MFSFEPTIQLILTLKYNKWCQGKVGGWLGIASQTRGPFWPWLSLVKCSAQVPVSSSVKWKGSQGLGVGSERLYYVMEITFISSCPNVTGLKFLRPRLQYWKIQGDLGLTEGKAQPSLGQHVCSLSNGFHMLLGQRPLQYTLEWRQGMDGASWFYPR